MDGCRAARLLSGAGAVSLFGITSCRADLVLIWLFSGVQWEEIPLSPEQCTSSLHLYGALVSAVHVTTKAKPFILRDL